MVCDLEFYLGELFFFTIYNVCLGDCKSLDTLGEFGWFIYPWGVWDGLYFGVGLRGFLG